MGTSGGTAMFSWVASATRDQVRGIYDTDRSAATSGHVGVSAAPTSEIDVHFSAGYRIENRGHPAESWIGAGLLGASADNANRGYATSDYDRLARLARDEDVRRTTVALNTTWRARDWLSAALVVGYDRLGYDADLTYHGTEFSPTDSYTYIDRESDRPETRTATLEGIASYDLRGMATRSTVGIQYIRDDDTGSTYDAVLPDVQGDPFSESRSWSHVRGESKGLYLKQQLMLSDRISLGGALRADRATHFGVRLDDIISRSLDLAWTAVDSRSGGAPAWLDLLRLRAAYGRGGDVATLTASVPPFGFPSFDDHKAAEQGSELEAGADAAFASERVRTSLTWYRGTTNRGFEMVPSAQGPIVTNFARVRTSGVESSIDVAALAGSALTWDIGAIVSAQRSEIKRMGGPPRITNNQLYAPGKSIGEYYGRRYSYADANGDGLIGVSEITILDDFPRASGSPFPSYEAALRSEMTVGGRVHLSAIVDHRGGARLLNSTAQIRCRLRCRDQNDPATPLAEQAHIAARLAGTQIDYIEDADYTKLREVRLAVSLPSRVARLGGASSARLSIIGRNLYTWTSYSGLDPEVTSASYDSLALADNFFQPTLRSFIARLDVKW